RQLSRLCPAVSRPAGVPRRSLPRWRTRHRALLAGDRTQRWVLVRRLRADLRAREIAFRAAGLHYGDRMMRRLSRTVCWLFMLSAVAVLPVHAQSPQERLGVPGPVVFQGTAFALAWSSNPSAGYFKQEYLP